MKHLLEFSWFSEEKAREIRDSSRRLVRAYAEACDAVEGLKKPWQWVHTKLGIPRPLFVVKAYFKDAVVRHIQITLKRLTLLRLRSYVAERPTADEMRLGIKKTAPPEQVATAEARRSAFLDQREKISGLLKEAWGDIEELDKALSEHKESTSWSINVVVKTVRRLLPVGFAAWFVAQFARLHGMPNWQLALYVGLALLAYHAFAWLALPFHDAGYRKYLLFEGYIGTPTDGLKPMEPCVSELESELFSAFKLRPPLIVSWEELAPLVHYVVLIALVLALWLDLPFDQEARKQVRWIAPSLIVFYLYRLAIVRLFLKVRYSGRSVVEMAAALFHVFDWSTVLEKKDEGETESPEGERQGGSPADGA